MRWKQFRVAKTGNAWLRRSTEQEAANRHNKTLPFFCQSSKPNDRDDTPTGTAVCMAWRLGKAIGHTTKSLGPNASTADAAYEALLLATHYIRDHPLSGEAGYRAEIRSTDANVARDCLKSGTRDHHDHIKDIALSLSSILDAHPSLQVNLGRLPDTKGSNTLRRLKAIAAETARQAPNPCPPGPSPSTDAITTTHHGSPRSNSNDERVTTLNETGTGELRALSCLTHHFGPVHSLIDTVQV